MHFTLLSSSDAASMDFLDSLSPSVPITPCMSSNYILCSHRAVLAKFLLVG